MVRGYYPSIKELSKGLDFHLKHRYISLSQDLMYVQLLINGKTGNSGFVSNFFCKVTKAMWQYNGVKVATDDGELFVADVVIIALPLGVLKENLVKFEPRLPKWKEAAIVDLGVGNENKIALFFNKVCWPNVDFLGIVAPTTYGCSYFLNLQKATGHPVLVYMPAGRLADDIEKMSYT